MAASTHNCRGPALPPLPELAARQGGAVGRAQLIELGLTPRVIDYRASIGQLHRVHRGVYAVGHSTLTPYGRLHAALLAVGPRAVLSHRTAAALWEIAKTARTRIEVTTTTRGRHSLALVEIHTVRHLSEEETTTHHGLRTTTVARTLLDLADVLPPHRLEHALEESVRRRLFDLHATRAAIDRADGRRGVKRLTQALQLLQDEPPLTRSDLERAFTRFCRHHSLPLPQQNVHLHGWEVDAHWPGTGVVVELDGRGVHATPQAFERDRRKGRALAAHGLTVIRLTGRQLEREAAEAARDVSAALRV